MILRVRPAYRMHPRSCCRNTRKTLRNSVGPLGCFLTKHTPGPHANTSGATCTGTPQLVQQSMAISQTHMKEIQPKLEQLTEELKKDLDVAHAAKPKP